MAIKRIRRSVRNNRGFTLVEFMIAMAITTAVLGGTVALASQIQQAYTSQLDDAALEQEVRYALDWIARYVRSAGSNPYGCPGAFQAVWMDPDGDGADDDIRLQADINPPNGVCTDSEENVTIAHNPATSVITLNTGAGAVDMTDPIITNLQFTYLDAARNPTVNEANVAYVGIAVTGQSEGLSRSANSRDAETGLGFNQFTLSSEIRLRTQ